MVIAHLQIQRLARMTVHFCIVDHEVKDGDCGFKVYDGAFGGIGHEITSRDEKWAAEAAQM